MSWRLQAGVKYPEHGLQALEVHAVAAAGVGHFAKPAETASQQPLFVYHAREL